MESTSIMASLCYILLLAQLLKELNKLWAGSENYCHNLGRREIHLLNSYVLYTSLVKLRVILDLYFRVVSKNI